MKPPKSRVSEPGSSEKSLPDWPQPRPALPTGSPCRTTCCPPVWLQTQHRSSGSLHPCPHPELSVPSARPTPPSRRPRRWPAHLLGQSHPVCPGPSTSGRSTAPRTPTCPNRSPLRPPTSPGFTYLDAARVQMCRQVQPHSLFHCWIASGHLDGDKMDSWSPPDLCPLRILPQPV